MNISVGICDTGTPQRLTKSWTVKLWAHSDDVNLLNYCSEVKTKGLSMYEQVIIRNASDAYAYHLDTWFSFNHASTQE
jgi:hypothetical protein